MRYLARDVSTFSTMVTGNYIYVDKTKYIYDLYATKDRYHFLVRPRRFGKSLLLSTLKELFSGNKELFKGLWIEKSDFTFEEHPIVHFDFSAIAHRTPEDMLSSLHERINAIGESYGIDVSQKKNFEDKLTTLIPKLAERNSVVLLIDEYDHPLLKHINNLQVAEENQKILKSFYESLKSMDAHYRAIFITGVTKFAKTSLFSGFNNLRDISESPQFASILGYTDEEIRHFFDSALESFATNTDRSMASIVTEMKNWYNGYRFSTKDISVYNPYSVVYYLKDQKCANYWFGSGTPSFLVEILKEDPFILSELEDSAVMASIFDEFEVTNIPTLTLLYQSGYLTIKNYEQVFDNDRFTLGYPNEEVKRSIGMLMVGLYTEKTKSDVEKGINKLKDALFSNDMASFCLALQKLFAQIPYQLPVKQEAYYHSLIQFLVYLLGFDAHSEISTSNGRIDLVIKLKTRIFLFEFKLNKSAQDALSQISEKRYYEKYQAENADITLVGISFNMKDKQLKVDCVFDTVPRTSLP